MGYIYQADVYCNGCRDAIRESLAASAPEDPMDQYSYDSDDYPKDADVAHEESDTPQHCAKCEVFFANPLTRHGYDYVQEKLTESGATKLSQLSEVLGLWATYYNFTYWTAEDCKDDGRHAGPGWYSIEAF